MIFLDKLALSDRDRKSGKTYGELLKAYYETGWGSFSAFYDSLDWSCIQTCEKAPDEVVVDGILRWRHEDVSDAKRRLLKHACETLGNEPVTYLEFGVREGVSMRFVASNQTRPDSTFHGFDTFEGLPEDWVPAWGGRAIGNASKKGEMHAAMPEMTDKRIHLFKGLIQSTLPTWLREHKIPGRLFVNIDTDLYTAALFILTTLHPYLKNGDLLYFDEFHDDLNEFAAFNDYVRSYYIKDNFSVLGRAYDAYLLRFNLSPI